MATRTGEIGTLVEFKNNGTQLAGEDRGTIEYMLDYSKKWPDTYHRYLGNNGYVTWAKNGEEVSAPFADR